MPSFKRVSDWPSGQLPRLLLGIALLVPLKLLGAESSVPAAGSSVPASQSAVPETQQTIPQTPKSDSFDAVEPSRDYLSGKITSFASRIDRFFGGDRHYQESNDSVFQVALTRLDGYGGDRRFDLTGRMNLRLPVTEGRLHLLIETDPEKNITPEPTKVPVITREKVAVPKSVALAARYATTQESKWHFSTDGGLKFPIPVEPFMRARGSYSTPLSGEWRFKAAESVYWFNTLGVGEATQVDFERIISTPLLFRASSNATWLRDKQNFDLRQDLTVYHTLSDRTALLYQTSVIGFSKPKYQISDYVLLVFYRYRLHQEWLFFEISPQMHYPRDKDYHPSPALSMRLEILFDDSR